jgi:hypothetical protein
LVVSLTADGIRVAITRPVAASSTVVLVMASPAGSTIVWSGVR